MNLNRIHERREGTDYLSTSLSLSLSLAPSYHYENHRIPFTTRGIIHHRPWNNERSSRWLLKMDNPFTSFPFDHVRNIHQRWKRFFFFSFFLSRFSQFSFLSFQRVITDSSPKKSTRSFYFVAYVFYPVFLTLQTTLDKSIIGKFKGCDRFNQLENTN